MKRSRISPIVIGFVLYSFFACSHITPAGAEERLTYIDLIHRLTDLECLATLPSPGEKCSQWSSYDRRSKYDEKSGKYIGWSANGDGNGIIRKEGTKEVFAEMEGPGVIWRIWSALAKGGHVKIYLDGSEQPAVDLPFDGYFNCKNEPFTRPALVHTTARGRNCYVPIPYQKSCRIVAEGDWGRYYHFTYTTYPKGTILPTFKRQLSKAESKALDKANEILTEQGFDPVHSRPGMTTIQSTTTIESGTITQVAQINGQRAITALKVNLDLPESPEDRDVLRELVLSIHWDGEKTPSVWVPLGDFFGSAAGFNKYKSLPLGMTDEGFYCYWYMPFKKSALIKLTNDGDKKHTVNFNITHTPLTKPINNLGRFHAKWHRDAFLPKEPERRAIDWTMLKTNGRGRFCGVMLHVWNPRGGWWGEGDEKFFVDGEKFPSTIGTGSEDYFGYAWCDPALFSNCYHNQTISMGNRGHISVNRWHITDNIPFQNSFEAAIEKYYPNDKPTLYAATSYWYQAAGQSDPYQSAPIEQRTGYWTEIEVFRVKGAQEGEKSKILLKTAGSAGLQDMYGYGPDWSGDAHLWWTGAKPGDTLDLAVPVKKTATYKLKMQLTKAIDYGIFKLYLDGKKLGGPIDLFNNGVIATGILDMGAHELIKGQHTLRIEITGANEKAVKSYMFGLDYLKLEEVQSGFYLPEDPSYTIFDSIRDSVRFAEFTLVPYKGHLCSKSSFVDKDGNIMGWHDFGNLEGPGWAANAVGGAYEIYLFARYVKNPSLEKKALSLLDHVLENGFINYETGFITGYRETTTNRFCLNYQHKNNWFCPGSMAKIAYQFLLFSDKLEGERKRKMREAAVKTAEWLNTNVKSTSNGWFPRRCEPSGKHYPQNAYGDSDILFEKSGDGLFIIQLYTGLTKRGLADYTETIREKINVFIEAGGFFGSINHDTYDEHENVAYSVAFRVLREAAKLLSDKNIRAFAYDKCLASLEQFKMKEDRNGTQTRGLLFMEKSWDTAYLWENAEAALAFIEAYIDTKNQSYLSDGFTILRAIAKHHHGQHGFLTEGVDWNNHVGKQHHFNQAEYGDIQYTEPLLNNLHIVEPTLLAIKLEATSLNPVAAQEKQAKHLVPADKGLSRDKVRLLFERGRKEVYSGKDLDTIGMPVGGIASGQLYLRGDGTLGLWQIFNEHIFTGYGLNCYRTYRPDSPVDSGFAVIVEQDGKTSTKILNKDFGKVEFAGSYPIGNVRYSEDGFPVSVLLKAYSPFIPLNAKDSALPATIFRISVRNTSTKKLSVNLLGWLENAVLIDSAKAVHALRRSRIVNQKKRTLIVHTAEKAPVPKGIVKPRPKIVMADFEGEDYGNWKSTGQAFGKGPANGTLTSQQLVSGFLGKGLVNTFLGGDKPHGTLTSPPFKISRKYINFLIGGGNHSGQTCINLLIDDKVVRTAVGKNNEKLEWYFWNVEQFEGKTAQIQIVDKYSGGWGHINIDQIELSDEPHKGPMGPLDKLPDYGSMVLALSNEAIKPYEVDRYIASIPDRDVKLYSKDNVTWPVTQRQSTALAAHSVELEPGTTRTFTFVLAWFFPNYSNGHQYANHFNSASDVAHYVLDNYDSLAGNTDKWYKTYYEHSTLPHWLLFRLHSTISNLATGTCQWWENGRFWAWEGVGCCTGTCTHVWNYAHAPARLFPQLERSAREMQDFGEGFDSGSGLVGFRSNRAYAADGQCGSVLKAYREHQASADNSFLKRNWPGIKKALEFSIQQDGNDDGLIENSQHNTYDINFEGPNTFVGSLYLAALRAAEEMAKDMGDEQFAKRCQKIFESGSRLTVERLWDGEYFIQLVDLKKHPKFQYAKGCLSDQLFGQGWAHQLGLGYIYPQQYVKKALQSVFKYNWAPDIGPYNAEYKPERWFARPGEAGLFTCTWPKSPYHKEGVRYRSEVWTGIEYQVAGHMVWEGMPDEALAICRGIQDRYHPSKHNPFNEVECGDHYARAMASWGVYTALAGYEYHGPKGHLGFAPKITPENFRAAFTAAEGWGLFSQKRDDKKQTNQIHLRWGKLNLKTLAFVVPEDFDVTGATVTLDREAVGSSYKLKEGRLEITLSKKLALSENQILDITIQQQNK